MLLEQNGDHALSRKGLGNWRLKEGFLEEVAFLRPLLKREDLNSGVGTGEGRADW